MARSSFTHHFEPPRRPWPKVPCVYLVDLVSGKRRSWWMDPPAGSLPPHFSGDGKWVYFTANGQVHRYSAETSGARTRSPRLQRSRRMGRFLRTASGSPSVATTRSGWRRSARNRKAGRAVSLLPDGRTQFRLHARRCLAHLLDGGRGVAAFAEGRPARATSPVQLKLSTEPPPPLLLRNVRVLDFKAGGFTERTSLLVEDGRIKWIGTEAGHTLPGNLKVVDGGGRFAIPGLFDMHAHTATPIHSQSARDVSQMDLWIAYGVTSVADMGSDTRHAQRLGGPPQRVWRACATGVLLRQHDRGDALHLGRLGLMAPPTSRCERSLHLEKKEGAVGVKSYFTLSWPLHRALACEAVKQGLPVRLTVFSVRRLSGGLSSATR